MSIESPRKANTASRPVCKAVATDADRWPYDKIETYAMRSRRAYLPTVTPGVERKAPPMLVTFLSSRTRLVRTVV
jgi:hypothetical protein